MIVLMTGSLHFNVRGHRLSAARLLNTSMFKSSVAARGFYNSPKLRKRFEANVARLLLLVKQLSTVLLDKLSQRPLE